MGSKGFFTDTTICIGCKACEVSCKQWNQLPEDGFEFKAMSYDNTGALGASTWRHVAFIERPVALPGQDAAADFSWLMMSDVCNTANARGASKRALQAQSCGPSSIRCLCSRTSAMAAGIASPRAHSASLTAGKMTDSRGNARSVMTV